MFVERWGCHPGQKSTSPEGASFVHERDVGPNSNFRLADDPLVIRGHISGLGVSRQLEVAGASRDSVAQIACASVSVFNALQSRRMLRNIAGIGNLEQFFKFIEWCGASERNLIFRGVKKASFTLTPSVGRLTRKGKSLSMSDERRMLALFRQKGYSFLKEYTDEDLEILSIAQHHGMPTRLLDWSKNPLVAAYFAVEQDFGDDEEACDSVIYVFQPKKKVELASRPDPFKIRTLTRFIPRLRIPRDVDQRSELMSITIPK